MSEETRKPGLLTMAWFKPLYRRVIVVAVIALWCGWEWLYNHDQFWGLITSPCWPMRSGPSSSISRKNWQGRTMPNLRIRPAAPSGHVHHVTPESAGWTYVGFDLHKLPNAGDIARGGGDDREVCIVLISGRAAIDVDGQTFLAGERMSPFEGPPHSVYAPAGASWHIEALTPLEVAVCSAPGVRGARPPRLIGPGDVETADPRQGHQYPLPHQHPARDGGRPIRCWWSR